MDSSALLVDAFVRWSEKLTDWVGASSARQIALVASAVQRSSRVYQEQVTTLAREGYADISPHWGYGLHGNNEGSSRENDGWHVEAVIGPTG